jgi:hypothetical protein
LINHFEDELLEKARLFLKAAEENSGSRAYLEDFGFAPAERDRGHTLVRNVERSFEWERRGIAWNFLSPTVERRLLEARHWYKDRRRRHVRACLRAAEEESGWVGYGPHSSWNFSRKATQGLAIALRHALRAASPAALLRHRAELRRNLASARGEKPADAPPPKDSALVELAGWYEHWRLLAQRIFRERPELMAPYGLVPGKAPPRLRSHSARLKFGEKAAGTASEPAPARRVLPVVE